MEVEQLRQEIQRLSQMLAEIETTRSKAKEALAEKLASFQRGEIITWAGRSGNRRGEVIGYRLNGADNVSYQVRSVRLDGSPGIEVEVQQWKRPTRWVA